jgi:hypothetical protein
VRIPIYTIVWVMIRFAMGVQYSNGKQQGHNKEDSSLAVDSMSCWASSKQCLRYHHGRYFNKTVRQNVHWSYGRGRVGLIFTRWQLYCFQRLNNSTQLSQNRHNSNMELGDWYLSVQHEWGGWGPFCGILRRWKTSDYTGEHVYSFSVYCRAGAFVKALVHDKSQANKGEDTYRYAIHVAYFRLFSCRISTMGSCSLLESEERACQKLVRSCMLHFARS